MTLTMRRFSKFYSPLSTEGKLMYSIYVSAEDNASILSSLQLMLLEHSVMCHLIIGSKAQAIKEIAKICQLLREDGKQLQVGLPS